MRSQAGKSGIHIGAIVFTGVGWEEHPWREDSAQYSVGGNRGERGGLCDTEAKGHPWHTVGRLGAPEPVSGRSYSETMLSRKPCGILAEEGRKVGQVTLKCLHCTSPSQ